MTRNRIIHVIYTESRRNEAQKVVNYLNKNFMNEYPIHKNVSFQTADKITSEVEACLIDPPCFPKNIQPPGSLKWAQSTWAGVDGFIGNLLKPLSFKLTRSAIYGRMISEYILCNILNHMRGHYLMHDNQKKMIWDPQIQYTSLRGKKLVVLGSGEIGTELSKMMKYGFEVETTAALVRNEREPDELVSKYFTSFECLMMSDEARNADFLVNILPSTNSTKNLLNFEKMSNSNFRNTIFVNVGRGSICSESDIISCLDNGIYRHAILDVFPVEPLPASSELWKNPGVIITPHVSGLNNVVDTCRLFMENVDFYLRGKDLKFEVNISQGY